MNNIKNKIIRTKNIKNTLQEYALANFTPLNECDFILQDVSTFIKNSSDKEFKLFNQDFNKLYEEKERILNEHVEIEQLYTIKVETDIKKTISLKYHIDYAEHATHPKIIILPDSIIPYQQYRAKQIFHILVDEINKIKVLNGVVINIFDEEMIKHLKVFTKYIYENKFTKRVRIPLFAGIEPKMTRASKLVFWYKEKETGKQVIEIDKDEILVEYKKPIYGKNGFNAHGQIVDNNNEYNSNDLKSKIDNKTISIIETENKKLYKSKIKGYLHIVNNTIFINNQIKLSNISRNETQLAYEEENNIEVHISQNDTNKDSIGEGVELVSESIYVSGHVGANSIIEATNLQVNGATHKDSTQFARFAKINRHKGLLRCHEAKIALLEGGEVHATNVDIESSLGGVIYAQNVKIGHVKSNLKIFASESISIRLVSGEDNKFIINYKNIPILTSKLSLIDDDITELKEQLKEATRHNLSQVTPIKDKIKKFRDMQDEILNSVFQANISIKKAFKGLNNIQFSINDEDELIFKTDTKEYTPFYLKKDQDRIILHPTNISLTQR